MHPNKTPWTTQRQVLVLLNQGLTASQTAQTTGVSRRTVFRIISEHGRMNLKAHKPRPGTLTCEQREQIRVGISEQLSDAEIGRRIGVHRGTIGREIRRCGNRDSYRAFAAQAHADQAAKRSGRSWTTERVWLWEHVQEWLRLKWSPQQISARLRLEHPTEAQWWVSHESIYQAIFVQAKGVLRKELASCLRSGRPVRRSHSRTAKARQGPIKDMVNISDRPAEVEDRAVPGHWEGDLICGALNRSQIATLVERMTRFVVLVKVDSKEMGHVAGRLAEAAGLIPGGLAKSVTWDQGTEMAGHKELTVLSGLDVYFCDPHSPWQRGTNENTNGLLRQFFPKGTDLSVYSQEELDVVAGLLNGRPRETLGWDTPGERFNGLVAASA